MGNQFDICGSSDMALEFVISKNNYIICLHCYKSLEIEYMSNVESTVIIFCTTITKSIKIITY